MKFIKYSKYVADPAGEMSMEDLLNALSDYLLQSGFQDSWYSYEFNDAEQTLEQLRQAIQQALESGEMLDENMREQLEQMRADGQLDELIEKLIDRMEQENYITVDQPFDRSQQSNLPGQTGEMQQGQVKFEVTDKGLDFLGYRALRDLLGSLGKSNFGRHDTREQATGVETTGAPKPYEFGDTLNLDAAATLLNAAQRQHEHGESTARLNVTHEDLMVVQ